MRSFRLLAPAISSILCASTLAGCEFLADFSANACHNLVFLREVTIPVRHVELICAQFMGNEGVPWL